MGNLRTTLLTALLVVGTIAFATGGVAAAGEVGAIATEPTASTGVATQAIDADCEYPLERTDARGETIELADEPEAVVALYPGDAQLAYQIGAEDRVVGMPIGPYTDDLEGGDRTDITGDDGVTPVAEEIVALDPDVVLAANVALADEELVDQLEDAGIPVYVLDTATSIDDVRENVETTGELTGECDGAEEALDRMDDRLAVIEDALADEEEPLAYYVSDDQGTTPGTETFQHEVLTTAGLENVAERADIEGWQEISAEVVVDEDPAWIVYPDWTDEPPIAESIEETTAYQEGNVVAVDDDAMSQPAPGIVDVIVHLVETVHPDVYAEIESDLESIDEVDSNDDGETDGDGAFAIPGFGAAAAVIALLAFVAVRTRSD
ncbi:PGF-CTERM-anchored ABC transporter substrate-binding protein [Natrialba swarupiae]|uniref:ABC transporter substrate-binding protein n=1 Tax=Natrialba swarupiae TaxID=2448032 RepID=A0A5D5AGH3_9EURY|nr:PGF-CTERM-anchored ABC transporter substrate-binding protein [Natrialba swarupiae]TYT60909.1 ABC transporter substrate-binding protein [Natrialba swarupiae]